MCRLYGYLSEQPTRVECALLCAQNSMVAQSAVDSRGAANPDGWGLAWWSGGDVRVERQVHAAAEDERFLAAAAGICTHALIAHVRRATIGDARIENVHPFAVGCWAFAHNGTIPGFDRVERLLLETTPVELRKQRVGTTDSELLFLWLLGRLDEKCPGVVSSQARPEIVADVLGGGLHDLLALCEREGAHGDAALNFIISDGRVLAAARCGRGLHVLEREQLHGCELCRSCHCRGCCSPDVRPHGQEDGLACRAFIVASEPITTEPWTELDEGVVVCVGPNLQAKLLSL